MKGFPNGMYVLIFASLYVSALSLISSPVLPGSEEKAHISPTDQHIPIQAGSLRGIERIIVSWTTDTPQQQVQLAGCKLLGPNGVWYDYNDLLMIPADKKSGVFELPLSASSWSGPQGPFDGFLKDQINRFEMSTGQLKLSSVSIAFAPFAQDQHNWALQPLSTGPLPVGNWYEWNFRLLGPSHSHPVELHLANGQIIPAFRRKQQALHSDTGPSIFTVRLRRNEITADKLRVIILDNMVKQKSIWETNYQFPSSPQPTTTRQTREIKTPQSWELPTVPAYTGWYTRIDSQSKTLHYDTLPAALAPILRWDTAWTGFKGPWTSNEAMAIQLDEQLQSNEVLAVDLLPHFLGENNSTFRFALSPWHHNQGGTWEKPQDILSDHKQQPILFDHIREIIARCRATPHLKHWQVGLRVSSDDSQTFNTGFKRSLSTIEQYVRRYDGRSLLFIHPDSRPFHQEAVSSSWLNGHSKQLIPYHKNQTIWKLGRNIDRSLWDISSQRLTIDRHENSPSNVGLSLYAWMLDEHHRYYQQHLGYMRAGESRRVVHIDWMEPSAWEHTTHPWHPNYKRRVRSFGLQLIADRPINDPNTQQFHISNAIDQRFPIGEDVALAINLIDPPQSNVSVWDKYQQRFELNYGVDNPYDPEQADVVAEIKDPTGNIRTFPAFWYEPMEIKLEQRARETVSPAGLGYWLWRYAFEQPGTWHFRIRAELHNDHQSYDAITPWHAIEVSTASEEQLLPISQSADPRYWQTSDGAWFYPIGLTIRSPGDDRQNILMEQEESSLRSQDWEALGTHAYKRWFEKMNQHGGNYIRMWMSPWWTALEWNRKWDGYHGLGRYNQANAARIDRILEDAKRFNIYLQLELASHGMTSEHVDEQWAPGDKRNTLGSPYNAQNGGPVEHAAEFYSDETAWTYHQRRLRYTVARWGWAPHIMSWVLSSEMEFTGAYWNEAMRQGRRGHSPTLSKWINRNLAWFKDHDLHQRPVSVHFSHPWRAQRIWGNKGLGFSYSNAYTGFQRGMGQLGRPQSGLGGALLTYLGRHFRPHHLQRPTLIGEWGGHWQEQKSTTLAAEWRTGLWMQAVLPYSGNTGFWWWLWVDASDSWKQMAPVRAFVMDEDPRGRDLKPIITRVRHPRETKQRLRMVASKGPDHIMAYAYHEWYDFGEYTSKSLPQNQDPEDWPSVRFETKHPNRLWSGKRYSTQSGKVVKEFTLRSDDKGRLILPLEAIQPDAAFRLRLQEGQADNGP